MSPRPGFVLEVDRSTPPTLFWHGEGFRLERLPDGQPGPLRARARRCRSTTRWAPSATPSTTRWATPHPLPALLRPGMQLTIAFDDVSLPLPPMRRPDIRQLVIEQVLDLAAEAGVDDVVLIVRAGAAPADDRGRAAPRPRRPHLRRLRPPRPAAAARRRGPRPARPSRAHRPGRGRRDQQAGGRRRTCSSTSTSTWWPWTAATSRWPPAWPATGACATTTTPGPCSRAGRSWTSTAPSCTRRTGGWAGSSPTAGVKVFQIETTLNTDTFPPAVPVPATPRVGVDGTRPGRLPGRRRRRSRPTPDRLARSIFHSIRSPHRMTLGAGRRGRGRARPHHRERLRPATASRWRARPTSSPWACPTSAPTT